MIIVEGPDGSGKTQLIKALNHDRRPLKSLSGGVGGTSPKGWLGEFDVPLRAYIAKVVAAQREEELFTDSFIAYDRFHLSERVYGPMLRNEQLITDEVLEMIGRYLRHQKIPVILCLPPLELTLNTVFREGRPRPEYQTEDFLRQAYVEFQKLAPYATVVYDYTQPETALRLPFPLTT